MPLIRLVSHPFKNKYLCDKIMFIDGIPDSMLYFQRNGKNYLKAPWTPDVTANIPEPVRSKFQPKPFKINLYLAPPEKGVPPIDDEINCYGLMLDYQNGQGEQMWESIEKMIDDVTPRGVDLPKPVIVEPGLDDEHRARQWTIGPETIESVSLTTTRDEGLVKPSITAEVFECGTCNKPFAKAQGLRMHKMKAHKKVPVGV